MNNLKPIIKVIGVGGGGCNAISFMSYSEIDGVEFIAANTDAQDLEKLKNVNKKIQLGEKLTSGLGAGADPKIGRKSAEDDEEIIRNYLEGANLLFISAGMGGGTGTGAAPVIAEIARKMGLLVIAVVTKPFDFERESRMNKALKGIEELRPNVDSLIIIPNQKLKDIMPEETSLKEVFESVDRVLYDAIQGISDIVTKTGFINIDFNDLKTIMSNSGDTKNSLIGIGKAKGEGRATKAALEAINCPFLEERNLSSANGVIVNVTLDVDASLKEFEEVGDVIKSITSEGAEVIMGATISEKASDEITVTIIATDFIAKENKEIIENKDTKKIEEIDSELPSFLSKNKNKKTTPKNENKNIPIEILEKIETKNPNISTELPNEILENKVEEKNIEVFNFFKKKI